MIWNKDNCRLPGRIFYSLKNSWKGQEKLKPDGKKVTHAEVISFTILMHINAILSLQLTISSPTINFSNKLKTA
jgi:hypothetical protein